MFGIRAGGKVRSFRTALAVCMQPLCMGGNDVVCVNDLKRKMAPEAVGEKVKNYVKRLCTDLAVTATVSMSPAALTRKNL